MALVLIAEDEAAMLEILGDVVEGMGHRTMRAHDGDEALLLAHTESPDLVITDHMMPRRTGIELLRALRAEAAFDKVPVLLITSARPEGMEEANAFLAKPVDIEIFEAALAKMLGPAKQANVHHLHRPAKAHGNGSSSLHEEMVNWLAHEIKTPLGAARMSAQLLIRNAGGSPRSESDKTLATSIIRQLDRINALITSILDAARVSEGRVALRPALLDLSALLREIVSEWRELQPQAAFTLVGAEGRIDITADVELLRHVLNNLLSNAVKYGGTAPRVQVSACSSAGLASIEVRDWGVGIPMSKVPTVFDRFRRADSEDSRGHGLGLFIAAALIRLHGGTLAVHSDLGRGSAFTVRLPLVARARPA